MKHTYWRFWSSEDWYKDYISKEAFMKEMLASGRLQKIRDGKVVK